MARQPITITLPEELIMLVDQMSEKAGVNRSQQIERLISANLTGDGADFYKMTEMRGTAGACLDMMRGLTAPDSGHHFHLDREWIVRILTKVKPGDVLIGGMTINLEGASADPTMDARSKNRVSKRAKARFLAEARKQSKLVREVEK